MRNELQALLVSRVEALEVPMKTVGAIVCVVCLLTYSGVVAAQTRATCTRGDCDYRFDDEAMNAPGYSAYGQWFTSHAPPKRVLLIRPRVS
jgi:hypothetical protein